MTPVCPACRAALFLDSFACWRCGLSVRPTCSTCGEPLMHGMDACGFCREPVTEPQEVHEVALARAATASPPPSAAHARAETPEPAAVAPPSAVTAPVSYTAAVPPPPDVHTPPRETTNVARQPRAVRRPSRMRPGRVIVRAMLLGILAAAGAVAYEASSTRNVPPEAVALRFSSVSLDGVGCDVSYPDGWSVDEAKRHATFLSGERNGDLSLRGFRVTRTAVPLALVPGQLGEQGDKFQTYEALTIEAGRVDGREAVRHVFLGNDLKFEQWWVERDKRSTIRIDLWSRPADDVAPDVDARIVTSLDVR